jgi:hypothetical protein
MSAITAAFQSPESYALATVEDLIVPRSVPFSTCLSHHRRPFSTALLKSILEESNQHQDVGCDLVSIK